MNFSTKFANALALAIRFVKPLKLTNKTVQSRHFWRKCTANSNLNKIQLISQLNSQSIRNEPLHREIHSSNVLRSDLRTNANALVIKKRPVRKKRSEDEVPEGKFNVFAYATAEQYDLEALHTALTKQDVYETRKFYTESDQDALHVRSRHSIEMEPRDIFFFREGSVVLWNCTELEANSMLSNLRQFEINSYPFEDVMNEKEIMNYSITNKGQAGYLSDGDFYTQQGDDGDLEKYTFSNALTSSVKLGIWEAMLDTYIEGIAFVTGDLKEGRKIRMSRAAVLRKTGELFSLKHLVNLDSDLLDTPDFYWDRETLEQLFHNTCSYFIISKRKRVINEKLKHCIELTDLVSSNLNDAHHVRLEWMIIILIMVEVGFEVLHYIDRYVVTNSKIIERRSDSSTKNL